MTFLTIDLVNVLYSFFCNYFVYLISQNMKLGAPMNADGGGSPMVKPKGDKQVEYLDLDLDPGKSTPPRKVTYDKFLTTRQTLK